ncbi:MAG: hypothetical protein IIY34_05490, partial [Clostridia bacterium]|nr:hypothetical protein [Clostridia bacterium]
FLPYCAESSRHFWRHHRNDSHVDASWYGEQTCLSMIHAINEKARWLLCLFAVEEAIAEHYIIPKKRMDIIVRGVTCSVIDGGAAVHDAVNYWIDDSCKLKKKNKRPGQADIIRNIIIQSITEKIEEYENRPSKRMQYR